MMKVIVLGAGVIGVASAYFLARAGHQVVVIDKNPDAGMGCSYANGGQLSYSHIETWANKSSLLWIVSRLITLGFPKKDFWRWFFEFSKNFPSQKSHTNSKKLFEIANYSKQALKELLSNESTLRFNHKSEGILHFYRHQKNFNEAIKKTEFFDSLGCRSQIFNAQDCIKKEPALVKLLDEKKLAGGIFYGDDESGDCHLFTKSMEKICREKYGVVFEYNTEIRNIFTNHKKITGINTDKEVFTANLYIYALGAEGISLLSGIKVDPEIYPLKGYSLSIPCDDEFIAPKTTMTDPENRVVYSHSSNIFRVSGSVEICGLKNNMDKKHINFLKNTVRSTFSDFGNLNKMDEWFGFRPFRPDSIPLINQTKYENLFLNTGHGSLGWTLAAGSAKILADLIPNNLKVS